MSVFEDVSDLFRFVIPSYFLILLTLFIVISPIDPIRAAQEFSAYRLQQHDLQGVKIGSRSSVFSLEAQTSYSKLLSRKCLLLKLLEASVTSIRMAISQNVGSVVILLPLRSTWDEALKEHISEVEKELLAEEFAVPIYFAFETEDVIEIYENVRQLTESSKVSTATQALLNSITSNGYLLYTANHPSKTSTDSTITNIYGKIAGNGIEEQLPTILVVAHYDTMGIAPSLSYGYDSNGSGVVTLLQLMKIFSRIYALPKSHAKYNIAFLLTGGGKLNYIGTKKWLDDILEHPDGSLNAERVTTVVCLERLGKGEEGLFIHVSKPPKEDSSSYQFIETLGQTTKMMQSTSTLLHTKINLNDDELHWEHERFSFKKISAMTLSTQHNKSYSKSILDDHISVVALVKNVRVITEALVRLIYGLSENATNLVTDEQLISEESILSDLSLVTRYPRSQQLLHHKHPLLNVFERTFKRYLQHTRIHKVKADPRDPEFTLYPLTEVTIVAHKVKPVIFDFMVACLVVSYLGVIYLVIENFSTISKILLKISSKNKTKEKQV